jgi:hypothetical protein
MDNKVELSAFYSETDFVILDDPPIIMRVGERHDGVRLLLQSFAVDTAVFLSGINPAAAGSSEDERIDRQMQLLSLVEEERLNYFIAMAEHPLSGWTQQSYFVLGVDKSQAADWAATFQQRAYIWIPPSGIPELILKD